MSIHSQQNNMRCLATLLKCSPRSGEDLQAAMNVGRAFLRALAEDLGLRDATILPAPGPDGTAKSCILAGMWQENGLYVRLDAKGKKEWVMLYRSIRHKRDNKGGYPRHLARRDLAFLSYEQLLKDMSAMRKAGARNEWVA